MTADVGEISWPPNYKIRKHRKAKYVRLYPSKIHGLEITVPYRFNLRNLPPILEEHKAWICEKLIEFNANQNASLPEQIVFPSLNETWFIEYLATNNALKIFERPNQEIILMGRVSDEKLCRKKLINWLKIKAKINLIAKLNLISEKIKLPFESVTIRDQKSRWGSCAADKSINLNYKLIFLPENLVNHVLIHELCHTTYLNHSDKFWELVAHYDPSWKINRRELRKGDKFIPAWV